MTTARRRRREALERRRRLERLLQAVAARGLAQLPADRPRTPVP